MNYREFKETLCNIDASKSCFEFLANRIADDGYRGIQLSQHNRYDMDVVYTILDELYQLVGTKLMAIRTTDLQKRPTNLPEERTYAIYVDTLSRKLGRCTQDSVRKNLFVDLHRMGLLERFNQNGTPVGAYENGTKKYVRISPLGVDFINKEHSLLERKLRYTRAIDTLTKGLADELLAIIELDGSITQTEFQFFLSFRGKKLNQHCYTSSELIDFIKEFRRLSRYQQEYAVKIVKEYCNPNSFQGEKTHKRDFHNWLNETQQIFMLMRQTAYFDGSESELHIRIGKDALYENKEKLVRSKSEKDAYFKQHEITKTKGFELHHIVPLCWAKTALEFATLDVWKNMIYIDGFHHSIITQSNNKHIKLEFANDDILFCDFGNEKVPCVYMRDVLYHKKHQVLMYSYNSDLLHSYGYSSF